MKKHRKGSVRDGCAHAAEGDGTNPKLDRDDDDRGPRHWKDRQLEHHARRAIESTLRSCAQAIEWGVRVVSVETGKGGSTLRVCVVWDENATRDEIQAWLAARQGSARAALARAMNRKRVPAVVLVAIGRIEVSDSAEGDDGEAL